MDYGPLPAGPVDFAKEISLEIAEMEGTPVVCACLVGRSGCVRALGCCRPHFAVPLFPSPVAAEERRGRAWVPGASGAAGGEVTGSASDSNRVQGTARLLRIVGGLSQDNLDKLLLHIRDWNTQSRHNLFAQQVPCVC
jgi:hypothetical protein